MRNVIATIIGLTLAFSANSRQAVEFSGDNEQKIDINQSGLSPSRMFDGISLTEHQRQQMRDLMQQARHDKAPVNISEIDTMHSLITAEKFDENAVRNQAERMAQEQVNRQVELARVRNQMFHLLTPEQQAVLNKNHQQRMKSLHALAETGHTSSLQLSSYSTRN